MISEQLVVDASRLIAFGLRPGLFPGKDEQYKSHLSLYRTDLEFRSVVDSVAAGLGLHVIAANELGLFLTAEASSVFAHSLAIWRRDRGSSTFEDRLLHGLAVIAIAAYFFPQQHDLESERHPRATASQVEQFLRRACADISEQSVDSVESPEAEWRLACNVYLRQKEAAMTADGRRSQRGTQNIVGRAFEYLADYGLVRRVSPEGAEAIYQPLERMRLQIQSLASHSAYLELSRLKTLGAPADV